MQQTLQVILPEAQKEQLMAEVHTTIMKAIEEARTDAKLDKPVLKKVEAAKWCGVSFKTFNEWIEMGMPVIQLSGVILFSKSQILQWLEQQAQ